MVKDGILGINYLPLSFREANSQSHFVSQRDSTSKMKSKTEENPGDVLPRSEERLSHVTKSRARGPQGRRLPTKPQRPNGAHSKANSVLDLDEDTAARDSRGRATSLLALETLSETHPKTRLDFDLGDESAFSNTLSVNMNFSNEIPAKSSDQRLSFEKAWFITLPETYCKSKEDDMDNTSDYSSMHGSTPSTKSSKGSPSPTDQRPRKTMKSRIEKLICSLF